MKAISFSSVSEASAAMASSPVRFRCFECGGVHRSDQRGWHRCAESLASDPRFGGLDVGGRPPEMLLLQEQCGIVNELSPYLGPRRESVTEKIDRLDFPDRIVGPFPALLSLTPEAFESVISAARAGWWDRVLSGTSSMNRLLSEAFPEVSYTYPELSQAVSGFSYPALAFPTVVRGGPVLCLFSIRWFFCCAPEEMCVSWYAGVSLHLWTPDAPAAAGRVLSALGVDGVKVVKTDGGLAVEPRGALKELRFGGRGFC